MQAMKHTDHQDPLSAMCASLLDQASIGLLWPHSIGSNSVGNGQMFKTKDKHIVFSAQTASCALQFSNMPHINPLCIWQDCNSHRAGLAGLIKQGHDLGQHSSKPNMDQSPKQEAHTCKTQKASFNNSSQAHPTGRVHACKLDCASLKLSRSQVHNACCNVCLLTRRSVRTAFEVFLVIVQRSLNATKSTNDVCLSAQCLLQCLSWCLAFATCTRSHTQAPLIFLCRNDVLPGCVCSLKLIHRVV